MFEAVRGPVQLKLRIREASLHSRQFKLRALVVWSQRWRIYCHGDAPSSSRRYVSEKIKTPLHDHRTGGGR
eukprot:8028759-Alexandrium_andersonii.AAC.1